jgi:hypothetical protein
MAKLCCSGDNGKNEETEVMHFMYALADESKREAHNIYPQCSLATLSREEHVQQNSCVSLVILEHLY